MITTSLPKHHANQYFSRPDDKKSTQTQNFTMLLQCLEVMFDAVFYCARFCGLTMFVVRCANFELYPWTFSRIWIELGAPVAPRIFFIFLTFLVSHFFWGIRKFQKWKISKQILSLQQLYSGAWLGKIWSRSIMNSRATQYEAEYHAWWTDSSGYPLPETSQFLIDMNGLLTS